MKRLIDAVEALLKWVDTGSDHYGFIAETRRALAQAEAEERCVEKLMEKCETHICEPSYNCSLSEVLAALKAAREGTIPARDYFNKREGRSK